MHVKRLISAGTAVVLVGAAGMAAANAAPRSPRSAPTVSVRSSPYGKILVTGRGATLYLWARDRKGKSVCAGACNATWRFVVIAGTPTAGTGVQRKLLRTIKVPGGKAVTYNKHPLYTFVSDRKPGAIKGEGNTTYGGPWWLVSPAGKAVTKKARHIAATP